MAKKNDNDLGSFLVVIFLFFATILVLLLIFGSIGYFLVWIYFEIKSRLCISPDSIEEIKVKERETLALLEINKTLSELIKSRNDAQIKKVQTKQEGNGLSVRQDGLFNEKSTLGKQLNAVLHVLNSEIEACRFQMQTCQDHIDDIHNMQKSRINKFLFYESFKMAIRSGLVVYAVSIFSIVKYQPNWSLQFSSWVESHSIIKIFNSYPELYGATTLSLFISLLSVFFLYIFYRNNITRSLAIHN